MVGYRKAGTCCSPTLAVLGSLTNEGAAVAERFAKDEQVKGKLKEKGHENLCRCMDFRERKPRWRMRMGRYGG